MWVDIFENICPSVKYLHKKLKSESRLAPALPSPDATVGDLARTHCSTAGLSAADAEHGNVQSNCSGLFLTNVIFSPFG